jgi:hypothetical protein
MVDDVRKFDRYRIRSLGNTSKPKIEYCEYSNHGSIAINCEVGGSILTYINFLNTIIPPDVEFVAYECVCVYT